MLSCLSQNLPFIYSYYYFFMFFFYSLKHIFETHFMLPVFCPFLTLFFFFFTIFHFFRLVLLLHFLLFFLFFLNIYHFRIVFLFIYDFPIPSLHRFRLVYEVWSFIIFYLLILSKNRKVETFENCIFYPVNKIYIFKKNSPFIFGFSFL